MIGKVLAGRYQIVERIGTGGMSLVYRGWDRKDGRWVAVKMLKHQWAEDEEVVRRFGEEARAAASLNDPHVVHVYEVGREPPDLHFMVMEYVDGETLRQYLDRTGPLSVEEALSIADQVAQALTVAHAARLIHRDIKPQNILLGADGVVKVTDFGIAYAATSGTLVNTGSLLGTVQYLSPEQARGKMVGAQSDIYSLGVVLFEMLTGRLPFEGDSPIGVAIKHLQDQAPRVDTVRPGIPEGVSRIVERALAKDPADRYQSAASLRQDLMRVQHGEMPAEAAAARAPERDPAPPAAGAARPAARRKRRRWWGWAVAAAVLLGLALGGSYAFDRWLYVPTVTVPDVLGQPVAAAEARLRATGPVAQVSGRAPSASVPAGHVLHEVPGPRSAVKAGRPVELVVSSGPVMVRVPLVRGEDVYQARQVLQIAGLRVRVRNVTGSAPAGQVVRQQPVSGTLSRQGTEVTIWVSKGNGVAQLVPDITGLTVGQAASQLSSLNLVLGSSSLQYSTQPANTVIDQNPAPYSSAQGVGSVDVVVSQGPSPASASATRNLSTARFQVPASAPPNSVVKVVVTDSVDNEEVYYQRVNPGETVNLPFVWYGTSGQLLVFLNGQAQPPTTLVPNFGQAPPAGGTGNTTAGG